MKKKRQLFIYLCTSITLLYTVISCTSRGSGILIFNANGEDFVRKGFIDKNGWSITFDKLFINLSNVTAYNKKNKLITKLKGEYMIDLAAGDHIAGPIFVGRKENIRIGNYQSLKFRLKRATLEIYKGFSIIMIGKATKNKKQIFFTIKLDEEILFDGKEGYVGEQIKGIVSNNIPGDVEMTFHFDHIFGDISAGANDHINTSSVGFNFFYQYAKNNSVNITQDKMKSNHEYEKLVKTLWTIGHLGEGHCIASHTSTEF